MTLPKSFAAVLLLASLCVLSCKKDKIETPPDTTSLFVFTGGGSIPNVESKTLQITADGSYVITQKNNEKSTRKLPANVQDSLKPYLSSFPRAAIKADPNTYSSRGALDAGYQAFIYVEKNPADTTAIYLDIPLGSVPAYFIEFERKINQTIINNKIFN
ncbi:hypothetical protein [Chitinophaga sp.]|uniref:hypothetical protein n=1 Tax=Chitinophaga sp. TaxID=1869181 RepID=UPI002BBCFB4B|nr:hypothetical protein [Chitinophaga sp.]HWV67463.1 hypothetical protein [Chitinophaga sp.]